MLIVEEQIKCERVLSSGNRRDSGFPRSNTVKVTRYLDVDERISYNSSSDPQQHD